MSLIFLPTTNALLRKDVTGAFEPEARAYQYRKGGDLCRIDNRKKPLARAADVLAELYRKPSTPHRVVAFFCHGTPRGIQLGFDVRNAGLLASAIRYSCADDVTVVLYCCSTASGLASKAPGGEGGFADALRDELSKAGSVGKVVAHETAGHCTKNPNVRIFYCNDGAKYVGLPGGVRPVDPDSYLWRPWIHALRTEFRYDFPTMTPTAIRNFLDPELPK
jgi:hypothetical protein